MRVTSLLSAFLLFALTSGAHAAKKSAPEVYSAEDPEASPADEAALLGKTEDSPNSDSGNAWAEVEPADLPAPEFLDEPIAPAPPVATPPSVAAVTEPAPIANAPTPKAPSSTAKIPQGWGMFDSVPTASRRSVAERLKLVSILIQKHGRAYDYRVHTVAQLKHILKVLEKPSL